MVLSSHSTRTWKPAGIFYRSICQCDADPVPAEYFAENLISSHVVICAMPSGHTAADPSSLAKTNLGHSNIISIGLPKDFLAKHRISRMTFQRLVKSLGFFVPLAAFLIASWGVWCFFVTVSEQRVRGISQLHMFEVTSTYYSTPLGSKWELTYIPEN